MSIFTCQKQYFSSFLVFLLAGCISSTTPSGVDVNAMSTEISATLVTQMTQTAAVDVLVTSAPIQSSTIMTSSSSLPVFSLDGYVALFCKGDDLYFQNEESAPTKLTHLCNKAHFPKLSDDRYKVAFFREDGNEYSINIDGSQEQILITGSTNYQTGTLEPGTYNVVLDFIPGTHNLLFQTIHCESNKAGSPCSMSISIANTDTASIKKLADLGLAFQQNIPGKNVKVSPDGTMIAVGVMDSVNIFDTNGKIIRQNILPYTPSTSTILIPALFWLPDSSGLTIALPNTIYDSFAYGRFSGYTLWRYMVSSNTSIQLSIDSSVPVFGYSQHFDISPDGNWILYGGLGQADQSFYLGNLESGNVQVVGDTVQPQFSWGPDSKHFIYTSLNSILGTVDHPPVLTPTCYLHDWVDANHFICFSQDKLRMAEIDVDAKIVKIYDFNFGEDPGTTILVKQK